MEFWLGVGVSLAIFLYHGVKYLYRSMHDPVDE